MFLVLVQSIRLETKSGRILPPYLRREMRPDLVSNLIDSGWKLSPVVFYR